MDQQPSDSLSDPMNYQPPLIHPNGSIYFRNSDYRIVTNLDLSLKGYQLVERKEWDDLWKQIAERNSEITAMQLEPDMEFFVTRAGVQTVTQFIDHRSQHASEPDQELGAFREAGVDVRRKVADTSQSTPTALSLFVHSINSSSFLSRIEIGVAVLGLFTGSPESHSMSQKCIRSSLCELDVVQWRHGPI
jgi:hypothetical protein